MWNKIYLVILAAASLAMGVLLYLSNSWLGSVTKPTDVAAYYKTYSNVSWTFLLVSTLVLLIIGNVLLWLTRRAWAIWATLFYFAVFMVAQTFWMENAFFHYKQANNLETGIISWSPLFGVVLIVLGAIIVFFNQYLIKRLHDKMYPAAASPADDLAVEIPADEKNI